MNGKVVVEGVVLPEGARVTVLTEDAEVSVRLSPAEEKELLAALDEADREPGIPADELLERFRKYD